jgi:hypothetical protein
MANFQVHVSNDKKALCNWRCCAHIRLFLGSINANGAACDEGAYKISQTRAVTEVEINSGDTREIQESR